MITPEILAIVNTRHSGTCSECVNRVAFWAPAHCPIHQDAADRYALATYQTALTIAADRDRSVMAAH